mmetsp:Transcript_6240/g.13737  ORF Transcript_6240/g.13737 Transcript_6240/m.13737 type:complete len:96 (-) Transcript_6240:16-303(-)
MFFLNQFFPPFASMELGARPLGVMWRKRDSRRAACIGVQRLASLADVGVSSALLLCIDWPRQTADLWSGACESCRPQAVALKDGHSFSAAQRPRR